MWISCATGPSAETLTATNSTRAEKRSSHAGMPSRLRIPRDYWRAPYLVKTAAPNGAKAPPPFNARRTINEMSAVELGVFGTISAAVICWAAAEALANRTLWSAAALLALINSAAAFMTFYDGQHDVARVETARQTAALTGIAFTGGIYVNYLFLFVWTVDAAWWHVGPASYARRSRALSLAIRGFIFFIILNGAVIFADGWARVVGVASVMLVVASWFLRRSSRRGACITVG
jgi:hypothetical protein